MSYVAWLPSDDGSEGASEEDAAFHGHLRRALDDRVELLVAASLPPGARVDALVRGVPSDEQLAACPALRHVFIPYAGLPGATRLRLQGREDLSVHNLHHNAASTAELALALLLAAAKLIVPHDQELRGGDWRRRWAEPETRTLAGGHAVVLGYGAIGQRVAHSCRSLGMRVTAVRRHAAEGDRHGPVELAPPAALSRILPDADAVIVCLPLTQATTNILDAVAVRSLKPSAYVVNVGRGPLIEEQALYEALAEGRLAGAGLDVWYEYPKAEAERAATLPSAFPFHELENVVLSPHRAGLTHQNEPARARALARLLLAAADGAEIPNRVDLDAGY